MTFPSSPRLMFGAALLIAVLAVLAVRYLPSGQNGRSAQYVTPSPTVSSPSASSTAPAFSSAHFDDPDPIRALGPEWTLLRQDDLTARNYTPLSGATQQRESVAKVIGKETQLMIVELNVFNKQLLADSFKKQKYTKVQVAGREGYIVPVADIAGGTGFVLVGDSTALLLQHGQSATWPTELEPEILSYIANVNVR